MCRMTGKDVSRNNSHAAVALPLAISSSSPSSLLHTSMAWHRPGLCAEDGTNLATIEGCKQRRLLLFFRTHSAFVFFCTSPNPVCKKQSEDHTQNDHPSLSALFESSSLPEQTFLVGQLRRAIINPGPTIAKGPIVIEQRRTSWITQVAMTCFPQHCGTRRTCVSREGDREKKQRDESV